MSFPQEITVLQYVLVVRSLQMGISPYNIKQITDVPHINEYVVATYRIQEGINKCWSAVGCLIRRFLSLWKPHRSAEHLKVRGILWAVTDW